jgi:hypothetical protein
LPDVGDLLLGFDFHIGGAAMVVLKVTPSRLGIDLATLQQVALAAGP